MPHRKRLYYSHGSNADGAHELRIDYGDTEITFDEAHLFAFAEGLVGEPSFTGHEATRWGPGYSWDELRPLLEALVAEGILRRAGHGVEEPADPRGGGRVASPLPASPCLVPRSWSLADCEAISLELSGHAFEIGHLEAVVPIYRIAHPALDGDGRQVGEANVFPPRLRVDVETEWRVCQYPGSRYRDDAPMNVTGLKAMIRHWKPILACVLRIRGALRERLGPPEPATGGRWTIGELHLMASLVLAVPAYQLMKRGAGSPPRPLHPILSSLFRITDGIRMTTHDMMFSVTRPHRADEPLSAAQLYDHAEINATLIGDTGVCAGPRALIEEFLATAVDGIAPRGLEGVLLPDEVTATLDELPRALEYGLHGMQTWPTSAVLALAISRCHEAIMAIVEPASGHPAAGVLIGRLRHGRQILDRLQLAIEAHRDVHFEVYVDSYERSWRALREPVGPPRLTDALAPVPEGPAHRRAAERLTAAFASHGELADALGSNAIERIVTVLVALLRSQQAVLGATAAIQKAINAVLDRPRPARPLTTRDLLAFYALTSDPGQFPDPLASVGEELGFRIEITASTITIV